MNNGQSLLSVGDAIKLLRPKAKFELNNKIFTKWEHPEGPPSWDEIDDMMKKLEEFLSQEDLPDVLVIE